MNEREWDEFSVCSSDSHRSTVADAVSCALLPEVVTDPVMDVAHSTEGGQPLTELLLRVIGAESPGCNPYEWAAALARSVTVGRPPYLRQLLEEDAFKYLEKAVHNYDATRPFVPWARGVLWRRFLTLYNIRRRTAPLIADPADSYRERSGDEWREVFQTVSDTIAAADFYPTPGGPDHYAAFVFDLRLRVAKKTRSCDEVDQTPLATVAGLLPWPKWFGPRRFLPDWPRVADIWAEAECRVRLPGREYVRFLGECVTTLNPELSWNSATWRKWVERGEESARQTIPPDIWQRYFQNLFPAQATNLEGDE